MTITISEDNRPLGQYTWVALLRDGTTIEECGNPDARLPFDVLHGKDVHQVHLVPFQDQDLMYIMITCQPGEYVKKVFTRTFQANLDTGDLIEQPVIDSFVLMSEQPIKHFIYPDRSMLITTGELV